MGAPLWPPPVPGIPPPPACMTGSRDHRLSLAPRGTRCGGLRSERPRTGLSAWVVPGWCQGAHTAAISRDHRRGTQRGPEWAQRWAPCPPLPNASCHPRDGEMLLALVPCWAGGHGPLPPCASAFSGRETGVRVSTLKVWQGDDKCLERREEWQREGKPVSCGKGAPFSSPAAPVE